jgi:hypothetical protein
MINTDIAETLGIDAPRSFWKRWSKWLILIFLVFGILGAAISWQSKHVTSTLQYKTQEARRGNLGVQPAERYVEMKPWEAVS